MKEYFGEICIGIILIVGVIASIVYVVKRHKKKAINRTKESSLYKQLFEAFKGDKKGYAYQNMQKYDKIISVANKDQIEYTLAIIDSNLMACSVDAIIMGCIPAMITFVAYLYALGVAMDLGMNLANDLSMNMLVHFFSAVILIVIMFVVVRPYGLELKMEKFFLVLLQLELEKRKMAHEKRIVDLEKKVELLQYEVARMKKIKSIRKRGVHIVVYK